MFDFPKAIAEPRGCGERTPGGVYAESGLSPYGQPIEHFLFDPPLPLPEGVDLVNKTLLWQRVDPLSGEPVLEPETGHPIYDLLIHIGAEHYPYASDYVEETRRLGASRKLNPTLDLSLLTQSSHMLLAHPRAIPRTWRALSLPLVCKKRLSRHDQASYILLGLDPAGDENREGPCIFKLWELIPQEEARAVTELEGERPLCLREIGSTIYGYRPTGEVVEAWETGFILGLPLTGLAFIQFEDGSVNEQAKARALAGLEKNGEMALPFYETDK
jgi:hypothetical protein